MMLVLFYVKIINHKYDVYLLFTLYRMENVDDNVADGGVCVLPKGVVRCEGIPRKS